MLLAGAAARTTGQTSSNPWRSHAPLPPPLTTLTPPAPPGLSLHRPDPLAPPTARAPDPAGSSAPSLLSSRRPPPPLPPRPPRPRPPTPPRRPPLPSSSPRSRQSTTPPSNSTPPTTPVRWPWGRGGACWRGGASQRVRAEPRPRSSTGELSRTRVCLKKTRRKLGEYLAASHLVT